LFARCWLAVTLDQYRASFAIAHQPGPRLLGRALLAQLLPGPRNATLAVLVPLALVPFVLALFVVVPAAAEFAPQCFAAFFSRLAPGMRQRFSLRRFAILLFGRAVTSLARPIALFVRPIAVPARSLAMLA
jgi:hypothetical protein